MGNYFQTSQKQFNTCEVCGTNEIEYIDKCQSFGHLVIANFRCENNHIFSVSSQGFVESSLEKMAKNSKLAENLKIKINECVCNNDYEKAFNLLLKLYKTTDNEYTKKIVLEYANNLSKREFIIEDDV